MKLLAKDPDERPTIPEALALLNSPESTKPQPVTKPKAPPRPTSVSKPKPVTTPKSVDPSATPKRPSVTEPATSPVRSTPAKEGADQSTGYGGLIVVAARIAVLLYGYNRPFVDWVSEGLNGEISTAQVGDCVSYVYPQGNPPARWVKAPCWSAATEYAVLDRLVPVAIASSSSFSSSSYSCTTHDLGWKNTPGRQQVNFLNASDRSAILCVVPR
ncbi:hypothetical protein [Streptomyces inhibens]|uniref:hypothetical protein n=1 Tax=Streptomyces inhibens TaxID=2293571 RepID=UPI001EE7386A|nr:hypothetical protein [Streptomyces inhibens]UKY47557.1 hypothetical protein KI385_00955 [Streptomyces inhibens]